MSAFYLVNLRHKTGFIEDVRYANVNFPSLSCIDIGVVDASFGIPTQVCERSCYSSFHTERSHSFGRE